MLNCYTDTLLSEQKNIENKQNNCIEKHYKILENNLLLI